MVYILDMLLLRKEYLSFKISTDKTAFRMFTKVPNIINRSNGKMVIKSMLRKLNFILNISLI